MEKHRIKTSGFTILFMIMLSFTQIVKIEATLPCPVLCALKCIHATFKQICYIACCKKCIPMSPSTFNCV